MGLDMYLNGDIFFSGHYSLDNRDEISLKREIYELGYWRKHPDLHGFIIQNFAGGIDECNEIQLSAEDLEQIIIAVEDDALPKTSGFFFGESIPEYKERTLMLLKRAKEWLQNPKDGEWRSVIYQASW